MAERTLPGLGLTGFWPLGADGWKDEMDENLRILSGVSQLSVLSQTTALPGSPTNGDIYIVPGDAPSFGGQVAIRDDGAWVYIDPPEGMRAWVQDIGQMLVRVNGEWVGVMSGTPKFQAFCNYDAYAAVDTWVKVPFNNEDHDDQAVFDTANNRFVAPFDGKFKFAARINLKINVTAPDMVSIQLFKNGTALARTLVKYFNDWAHEDVTVQTESLEELAAGDQVDVRVFFTGYDAYVEANSNSFNGFQVP